MQKLKSIVFVAGAMLLILAAVVGYISIEELSAMPSADSCKDRGVYTFVPYEVASQQVKNTSADSRDRRMHPTKTVYIVCYRDIGGSGYRWTEQVLTPEMGQAVVDSETTVERRVLSIPDRNVKIKPIFCAFILSLLLLLLSGCSMGKELAEWAAGIANDAMAAIGGNVQDTLDDLHDAEYQGGPFENNLDSARAYLLEQMQEKYGIEFTVVGDEDLVNYGPFAGATYTCNVAPVDAPEQVTTALVSQTQFQDVRDGYAVYFFKEEAEAQAVQLCMETEYVQSYEVSLQMPQTARTWSANDDISDFLQTSDAYLSMKVYLGTGKSDGEYADLILDFLEKVYDLNANVKLSMMESEDDYIFWGILNVLAETPPQLPTKEKIIEDMEIARMM